MNWLLKLLGCKEEELKLQIENLKKDNYLLQEEIIALKSLIKNETINSAKKLETISYLELKNLLSPYCENIYLSDNVFSLTSVEEAKKYSIQTKVYINKWKSEEFDCDEFSFALMGYWNLDLYQFAFGIAWSNVHAFNIMIDDKKQVWIIEPQSNKFIKIEDAKSPYTPLRVIMI